MKLSDFKTTVGNDGKTQQVNFLYVYDFSSEPQVTDKPMPEKIPYADQEAQYGNNILTSLNYVPYKTATAAEGNITTRIKPFNSASIHKREIWPTKKDFIEDGEVYNADGEPYYKVVARDVDGDMLYDYNISSNRYYDYLFYINFNNVIDGDPTEIQPHHAYLYTSWAGWSITELHPILGNDTKYTATSKDVWKFRFNVSTGQQTQNMSKQQQETLARFPRFSQGPKNAISGSVSCLMGSEMTIADYSLMSPEYTYVPESAGRPGRWMWVDSPSYLHNNGGYQERLDESRGYYHPTSNKQVDMLNAWRDVCFSGNPKLLKDPMGQTMLIQIISNNNETQYDNNIRSNQISFDWIEIGDASKLQITGLVSDNDR